MLFRLRYNETQMYDARVPSWMYADCISHITRYIKARTHGLRSEALANNYLTIEYIY